MKYKVKHYSAYMDSLNQLLDNIWILLTLSSRTCYSFVTVMIWCSATCQLKWMLLKRLIESQTSIPHKRKPICISGISKFLLLRREEDNLNNGNATKLKSKYNLLNLQFPLYLLGILDMYFYRSYTFLFLCTKQSKLIASEKEWWPMQGPSLGTLGMSLHGTIQFLLMDTIIFVKHTFMLYTSGH